MAMWYGFYSFLNQDYCIFILTNKRVMVINHVILMIIYRNILYRN